MKIDTPQKTVDKKRDFYFIKVLLFKDFLNNIKIILVKFSNISSDKFITIGKNKENSFCQNFVTHPNKSYRKQNNLRRIRFTRSKITRGIF